MRYWYCEDFTALFVILSFLLLFWTLSIEECRADELCFVVLIQMELWDCWLFSSMNRQWRLLQCYSAVLIRCDVLDLLVLVFKIDLEIRWRSIFVWKCWYMIDRVFSLFCCFECFAGICLHLRILWEELLVAKEGFQRVPGAKTVEMAVIFLLTIVVVSVFRFPIWGQTVVYPWHWYFFVFFLEF